MIKFFLQQSATNSYVFYCDNEKCIPKRGALKFLKKQRSNVFRNLKSHLRSCDWNHYKHVYIDYLRSASGRLESFASLLNAIQTFPKFWNGSLCTIRYSLRLMIHDKSNIQCDPARSKHLRKYILSHNWLV